MHVATGLSTAGGRVSCMQLAEEVLHGLFLGRYVAYKR